MKKQLPLGFILREDATFSNFYENTNEGLIFGLKNIFNRELNQHIYLHGAAATGKSHLLQAVCHLATEHGKSSVYVPLNQKEVMTHSVLDGLENLALICLDAVDEIVGDSKWEESLFHLLNNAKMQNASLVMSSRFSPNHLKIELADLKSRLNWFLPYYINPVSDDGKVKALQLKAKSRGFILNDNVARFILSKGPHDLHKLFNMLEKIDNASLSLQRKVTIPLVKDVLLFND